MKQIFEKVKDFADKCHGEQLRKYTPERYIVHPVRVMELLGAYTQDEAMLAAALLHDVLEDTPVTKDGIRDFLVTCMDEEKAARTVKLVVELTDVYVKSAYPQWNRRRRKEMEVNRMEKISPEAQTIKYADIIDNCREIVQHDRNFAGTFLRECRTMLAKLQRGNPELRAIAEELVAMEAGKLR